MNPDDPTTPDMARCDICGAWKPRDEMHHGTWSHTGEAWFCDDCQAVPF